MIKKEKTRLWIVLGLLLGGAHSVMAGTDLLSLVAKAPQNAVCTVEVVLTKRGRILPNKTVRLDGLAVHRNPAIAPFWVHKTGITGKNGIATIVVELPAGRSLQSAGNHVYAYIDGINFVFRNYGIVSSGQIRRVAINLPR